MYVLKYLSSLGTIIGFESGTHVALEAEGSVLICLQVLNEIGGHSHQTNDSVNLIILSSNISASKRTVTVLCRSVV